MSDFGPKMSATRAVDGAMKATALVNKLQEIRQRQDDLNQTLRDIVIRLDNLGTDLRGSRPPTPTTATEDSVEGPGAVGALVDAVSRLNSVIHDIEEALTWVEGV
jgi:hypothetical protein